VVGGTGGLGSAVVDALVARGDRVLATGRAPERLEALRERGVAAEPFELADPSAAPRLAAVAERALGGLDGLVVAAGGLGAIGPTRTVDPEGVTRALEEHVVGALRVVQALADLLDRSGDPSVVLFSGGGATGAFPRYTAYALAKVATVRLVENLAAEEPGWRVNAVAPGFVATSIHDTTLEAGPETVGAYFEETERRLGEATPPTVAARLVTFLLDEASRGITGRLISAVWDPWETPDGQRALREDDSFGRLRRIDGRRYEER
jgi:3-oxoacyl-[acyl-carrier protein] reductase